MSAEESLAELSFEALSAHRRHLLAFVRRRGIEHHAAEDVVAEALLVAWRRRGDLPAGEAASRAWLVGVTRNIMSNWYRGERRRRSLVQWLRDHRLQVRHQAPELTLERVSAAEAWASLSPHDQEILLLAGYEGLGPDDLADAFECSPGAAMTRLSRARSRLDRALCD